MSLFRRHGRCFGVRVWKWNQFQIEVWFCARQEEIESHKHDRIDSTIVMLAGDMFGTIDGTMGHVKRFKKYRVPAGTAHDALIGRYCIFANLERWTGEVTSAADDFTAL